MTPGRDVICHSIIFTHPYLPQPHLFLPTMPSELLHFPPAYTVVGLYRLLTDPSIRTPVLDKIRHASIRGLVVGLIYAAGSWRILDWFIRRFLVGGSSWFGGNARARVGQAVQERVGGVVKVGLGRFSFNVDLVFCR